MASRRRLSHNNECLGELIEDDDEEELLMLKKVKSRNSVGGRMSVGGRGSMTAEQSAEEQNRITEMYKTVIKMSSENKINDKNSWSFDLIDHMGKLIRDEGRGVNFQKASCTLDASVKIYSHRVDDTHASGHRILESLTRNGNNVNDDGAEEGEEGVTTEARRKHVNRHVSSETIEKNLDNINGTNTDETRSTDPMFHKMSKAFDEGGAKGMLMNNMRIHENTCNLAFSGTSVGDNLKSEESTKTSATQQDDEFVDISDLIYKSGIMLAELSDLEVCPAFDDYRDTIGIAHCGYGVMNPSTASMFLRDLHIASTNQEREQQKKARYSATGSEVSASSSGAATAAGNCGGEDHFECEAGGCDDFGDDDGDNFVNDSFVANDDGNRRRLSMCVPHSGQEAATSDNAGQFKQINVVSDDEYDGDFGGFQYMDDEVACDDGNAQVVGKIHWDSVFDSNSNSNANSRSGSAGGRQSVIGTEPKQVALWQQATIMNSLHTDGADEYNFINFELLSQNGNDWAGSKHWKVAAKSRAAKKAVVNEEEDTAVAGGKPTKQKKAGAKQSKTKAVIDWTGEAPPEELFATGEPTGKKASKSKTDPTVFSNSILSKQQSTAEEGAFLLPVDAHVEVLDLSRLMLVPNIVYPNPFPAAKIRSILMKKHLGSDTATNAETTKRFNINSLQDKVWGELVDFTSLTFTSAKPFVPGSHGGNGTTQTNIIERDDDNDYCGDYDYGGDDDNGFDYAPATEPSQPQSEVQADTEDEESNTLSINTAALLKASRVVEKVSIGYSTAATKVNVRKLKTDIWSKISDSISSSENDDSENVAPSSNPNVIPLTKSKAGSNDIKDVNGHGISFQRLISSMAAEQKQTDVSLPYYFICLLHLANEKTLRIEDTASMDDLFISGDVADSFAQMMTHRESA